MESEETAFLLGAVRHTSAEASVTAPKCDSSPCDQVDWAKRWSLIIKQYNTIQQHYRTTKRTCIKFDKNKKCIQRKPDDFNDIVERGVIRYYAR
jgi:hypothetical protein